MRRRKQVSPADGWCCGEAVTVVMASQSCPRHRAPAERGVRRIARRSRRCHTAAATRAWRATVCRGGGVRVRVVVLFRRVGHRHGHHDQFSDLIGLRELDRTDSIITIDGGGSSRRSAL